MLRSRSFDLTNRILETEDAKVSVLRGSVGADLQDLARDRAIVTDPEETRRRRTIRLTRQHLRASWGFTLQTYGIRNKRTREVEVMSYVDYVEINGPAWLAGMKKGDVILSVNGDSVDSCTHLDLVTKVQRGGRELRLVVLFEDCCKKVELQERYIKLKKLLNLKLKELRHLEGEESRLLKGGSLHKSFSSQTNGEVYSSTPTLMSRLSALRQSAMSHSSAHSSGSSDWDRYSEITSPLSLEDVPANQFAFNSSLSDVSNISSAPDSAGSAHDASISGSSDSQSEFNADAALTSDNSKPAMARLSNEESDKALLTSDQKSQLDISGAASADDDGDTDSQTSFFLTSQSPPKSPTKLTDIITGGEPLEAPEHTGREVESFRQMYTVARWVGVNASSGRRQSTGLIGLEDADKASGSDANCRRGLRKARSLSSVNESGEEGESVGQGSAASTGREEDKGIGEDMKVNTSKNTATNNGVPEHQLTPKHSFYQESDSEDSSVVGGDLGRTRRDTVISVTDYYDDMGRNRRDTVINVGNDYHADMDVTGNTQKGLNGNHTGPGLGDRTPDGAAAVSRAETDAIDETSAAATEEIGETTASPSNDNKNIANMRNPNNVPNSDTSGGFHSLSSSKRNSPTTSYQNVNPNEPSVSQEHTTIGDLSSCQPDLAKPRFVQGVLVNDVSYVTKL